MVSSHLDNLVGAGQIQQYAIDWYPVHCRETLRLAEPSPVVL